MGDDGQEAHETPPSGTHIENLFEAYGVCSADCATFIAPALKTQAEIAAMDACPGENCGGTLEWIAVRARTF